MPDARRLTLPAALIGSAAVAVLAALYILLGTSAAPPNSGIGGGFALQAGNGRTITPADEVGRPFLVFFGYTHCPDVCPTTLSQISAVFGKLGPDARIAALFITVDPERDTPQLMKDYVSSFDSRIVGLSGTKAEVEQAMKAYRVFAAKSPARDGDYSVSHSAVVYLMSKRGEFVNAVNLEQPPETVAKDLRAYL